MCAIEIGNLFIFRHKHGPQYMENGERLGLTALILRTIHRNGHIPRGKGKCMKSAYYFFSNTLLMVYKIFQQFL